MEIPDLVRDALGDEEIQAGVSLGDEDTVCFTPTRTIVYRGEGLLSDEGVSEYPFDFERLAVSEGRRKTKFTLTYVDEQTSFAVPGNRTDAVLERLLEGALRNKGVIEADEALEGVFRFSELTLLVAQHRLVKHIGEYTWDPDYETYPYDDVTGLHFEDGSVATAVVLEAGGRPERIKAPNDQAALLRKTLEEALFAHHGVDSLEQLNRVVAADAAEAEDEDAAEAADGDSSGGLGLDSGIDPLVDEGGEDVPEEGTAEPSTSQSQSGGAAGTQAAVEQERRASSASAGSDDLAAVESQLSELTEAVQRQNKLLKQQQQTVQKLIEELRQGR